jgi:hypothetical protein
VPTNDNMYHKTKLSWCFTSQIIKGYSDYVLHFIYYLIKLSKFRSGQNCTLKSKNSSSSWQMFDQYIRKTCIAGGGEPVLFNNYLIFNTYILCYTIDIQILSL